MRKIAFIFLTILTQFCYAQEKINSFDSNIFINQNASANIIETIKVESDGRLIKRGIVRKLPLSQKTSYNVFRKNSYQVVSVTVNGKTSKYHIKKQNNYYTIYIGEKNKILPPGEYIYQISYLFDNVVHPLKDADEVYFNVTGNNWLFPIESATATINLPKGAVIMNAVGYEGKSGSKNHSSQTKINDSKVTFATTRPLLKKEGLTVAVSWPKGFITFPSLWDKFTKSKESKIAVYGTLLVLCYYLFIKMAYASSPPKRTIIPLFKPISNISPAGMRFISKMKFDGKVMSAAIVNLAIQNYLTIKEDNNTYTLTKNETPSQKLNPIEKNFFDVLLSNNSTLVIDKSNRATINNAKSTLSNDLKQEYENEYFITNIKYVIPGCILSLIIIFLPALHQPDIGEYTFPIVWSLGWAIGCVVLLIAAWKAWRQYLKFKSLKTLSTTIISSFIALVFTAILFIIGFTLFDDLPTGIFPAIILLTIMNVLFYYELRVATPQGREIMNQIDGFKLFLSTTKKYKLAKYNPPEITSDLYEKYLPYAIALDVENLWTAQFNDALKASTVEQKTYRPTWYAGSRTFTPVALAAFPTALSSSLTSGISSSSSASSGGGSSGGGSGGGGGGGW